MRECRRCNGKGLVFDRMSLLSFGFMTACEWLFDGKEEDRTDRKICPECEGTGVSTPQPRQTN